MEGTGEWRWLCPSTQRSPNTSLEQDTLTRRVPLLRLASCRHSVLINRVTGLRRTSRSIRFQREFGQTFCRLPRATRVRPPSVFWQKCIDTERGTHASSQTTDMSLLLSVPTLVATSSRFQIIAQLPLPSLTSIQLYAIYKLKSFSKNSPPSACASSATATTSSHRSHFFNCLGSATPAQAVPIHCLQ